MDSRSFDMALLAYKRPNSDEGHLRYAFGITEVFEVGMALLDRGDEIISITPNRGEHPIEVEQVRSAKANRDGFLAQGIPCAMLPVLVD